LESPILLRVGQATALNASDSLDPAGGGLTFSWDLDGDGAFDDATGPVVDAVADAPGRWPLAVRIIDADGTVDVRTAVAEAELRGGAPVFLAIGPEEVEVRVSAGDFVSFLGLAQDPEGSGLTYTFLLDGDEVSSVVATDEGEPGIWDWLPDDGAVGVHQIAVEASDGSSTALVARHTWPVWVSEGTGTDGSDGTDGITDGIDGTTNGDSGDTDSPEPGSDPTEDECGCSGGGGSAIGLFLVAGAFGRRRR
jgi:MYXO-CTERM domain-containing protein